MSRLHPGSLHSWQWVRNSDLRSSVQDSRFHLIYNEPSLYARSNVLQLRQNSPKVHTGYWPVEGCANCWVWFCRGHRESSQIIWGSSHIWRTTVFPSWVGQLEEYQLAVRHPEPYLLRRMCCLWRECTMSHLATYASKQVKTKENLSVRFRNISISTWWRQVLRLSFPTFTPPLSSSFMANPWSVLANEDLTPEFIHAHLDSNTSNHWVTTACFDQLISDIPTQCTLIQGSPLS